MSAATIGTMLGVVFVAGIAALSAGFALWGKQAFAQLDDALLAERWFAFIQKTYVWITVPFIGLSYVTLSAPLLGSVALPAVVALAVYPARKRVFDESWPVGPYLLFQLRVFVAFGGFWLALGLLPELVRVAPMNDLVAAALGALLTLGVLIGVGKLYPQLIGATPLRHEALEQAFAPVIERARCAQPALFVIAPRGGKFVNALALPDPKKPRVMFGGVLLEQLSTADMTGILGHELAHLEHHDRAYLRRVTAVLVSLIALGAALTPVMNRFAPAASAGVTAAWAMLVLVGWIAWMSSRQAHEGDCDVRAVELVGDGEVLISGLTKLHAIARVPKRLAAEHEASATHPTLQRRIERLRAAMGGPRAQPAFEPLVVRDANTHDTYLVLSAGHFRLLHGVAVSAGRTADELLQAATRMDAVALSDLASLSLEVRGTKRRLVAVDTASRQLALTIEPHDVAAVQAALDGLDARGAITATQRKSHTRQWATLLIGVALTAVTGFFDPPVALGVLGFLAIFASGHRPTVHAVAAACASYCLLAVLQGRDGDGMPALGVLAIAAIGAFAAWASWAARAAGPPPPPSKALSAVLGLLAIPSALGLLAFAVTPIELYFAVYKSPSLVVSCAALAGALYGAGPRRIAAGAFGVLALLGALSGTDLFRQHVIADPLLVAAPRVRPMTHAPALVRETKLEDHVADLQVSPGGRWALFRRVDRDVDYGYDERPGGPLEVLDLQAAGPAAPRGLGLTDEWASAVLIDDQRVLTLENHDGTPMLSVLRLSDLRHESDLAIDEAKPFGAPKLSVDRAAQRYWIHTQRARGLLRLAGPIGALPDARSEHRQYFEPVSAFTPSTIEVAADDPVDAPRRGWLENPAGWYIRGWLSYPTPFTELTIRAVGPDLNRKLFTTRVANPRCLPADATGKIQWCYVHAPQETQLIRLDTATGEITPAASFPRGAYDVHRQGDLIGASTSSAVHLLNTRTGRMLEIDLSSEPGCYANAVVLLDALAVARNCESGATIQLLTMP